MRGQSIGIHSSRSRGTCRLRRVGRRSGTDLGAVEVDPADIGLVAQQPAEGGVPPGGFPGRRGHAVGVEPAADLADGDAGGPVGEDPPHHGGFGFVDLQVRRPVAALRAMRR